MKTLNSILILIALAAVCIYAVTFTGCSDTITSSIGTAPKTYKALTERDFADKNLKAEPDEIIIVNLEDLHSPIDPLIFDTDLIGIDIIPYTYIDTVEQTLTIGDSSYFTISLINENTKQVVYELTLQHNNITVTVPAGDYLMVITSLEEYKQSDSSASQLIFIQPDTDAKNKGNHPEEVDYNTRLLYRFFQTNRCSGCDLTNVNLSNQTLNGADLSWANLNNAKLRRTNLSNANLNGTRFISADLTLANLHRSNSEDARFTNAKLEAANLTNANLKGTNFENANLTDADLSFANISNANFCGATKTFMIRTGVIINSYPYCWY